MNNQISSVTQDILQSSEGQNIELKSPQWLTWLETAKSFRYLPSESKPFTARREGEYWYGYRKQQNKLHKRYIGKPEDLTSSRLEEIAVLLNTPTEPRQRSAKQQTPATVTDTYVTLDEMQNVYQQLAAIRAEVAALGK